MATKHTDAAPAERAFFELVAVPDPVTVFIPPIHIRIDPFASDGPDETRPHSVVCGEIGMWACLEMDQVVEVGELCEKCFREFVKRAFGGEKGDPQP